MTSSAQKSLVVRIGDGDSRAEAELVERFSRPLRLILLQRTRDPHLAGDLVQETFIIALRKLRAGEVRNPDALAAFLRQTAINLSNQHFRKEKRYVRQDDGIISLKAPHSDRKGEGVDRAWAEKELESLLMELSIHRDREILRRYYLNEEDKPSICQSLELSPAHFDRVLYRARQRMRQLLAERVELKALLFGSLFND